MPRGTRFALRAALFALLLAALSGQPTARAEADPAILERVIPAAVQIAIIGTEASGEASYLTVASGTIISPDGVILTNAHAVDMAAHREMLRLWQDQSPMVLDESRLLILDSDGITPAAPRYVAQTIAQDQTTDLALLRIVGDAMGTPLDPATLALPWVPLGDSDALHLAEPIDILSYPAAGGDGLTYTSGAVSGFDSDGSTQRLWINTDATLSGGSSGGTAINRAGELIGIPTQGSELDCRPGDTNLDGQITAADVGCIPVGGSIGQLRPANLAKSLLAETGLAQPLLSDDDAEHLAPCPELPEGFTPLSGHCSKAERSDVKSTIETFMIISERDEAPCITGPLYAIGETLELTMEGSDHVLAGPTKGNESAWLPSTTRLQVVAPLHERGACDGWLVQVVWLPPFVGSSYGDDVIPLGTVGLADERTVRRESPSGAGGTVRCLISNQKIAPDFIVRHPFCDAFGPGP